jgi:hypothetical protein
MFAISHGVFYWGRCAFRRRRYRQRKRWRGELGIYVEDRFELHFSATHYTLKTSSGSVELVFPSPRDVQDLTPGSDIEVTGHRQGGRFVVADDAASATNAIVSRPGVKVLRRAALKPREAAFGQRKIAVILVNYLNQTSQPITMDQAASFLNTVNQYYQEASYQQYSISGDVYGYLSLPINEFCSSNGSDNSGSDFTAITSAGIQAAQSANINLSTYQSYVFIGPTATNCEGGYASILGSEQESDRTSAGMSLVDSGVSVDWRGEARRLEQNPRLAGLPGLPG